MLFGELGKIDLVFFFGHRIVNRRRRRIDRSNEQIVIAGEKDRRGFNPRKVRRSNLVAEIVQAESLEPLAQALERGALIGRAAKLGDGLVIRRGISAPPFCVIGRRARVPLSAEFE